MDNYKIPTNVKQVGNVDENLRVYIEDYVYSYLLQYAKVNVDEESIALLIGRCMIIDGKKVLFISGAIQGLYAETKKGILTFSNETYEYVEEQRLKHFKGLEVVGWMLSQPGYGTYLSTGHMNYHIDNFKKPYQVMFVLDTIEKMNTFFQYDKEEGNVREMEGFFVFYEKNKEMHDYMLENKIEANVEDETKERVRIRKIEPEEIKEIKEIKSPIAKTEEIKDNNETKREINIVNLKDVKKIKKTAQSSNNKEKIQRDKNVKLTPQLLAGGLVASLVLLLSVNVMQSDSKIAKLEDDINVLTSAYNLLVTHINNSNNDNVSQVFASSDVQVVEQEYIEEMPEEDEIKTDAELENEEYLGNVEVQFIEDNEVVEQEQAQEQEQEQVQEPEQLVETFVTKEPEYYVVKQGDSLISISREVYGTDKMQQEIMDANNIENPNKIYFGMKLLLP